MKPLEQFMLCAIFVVVIGREVVRLLRWLWRDLWDEIQPAKEERVEVHLEGCDVLDLQIKGKPCNCAAYQGKIPDLF